ncbi:MAG: transporter substrate-binding domain-containing protein [Gammaproteobacteria bacterium]|nr:transporter substrate-binding domain-containing protein [Gammaproteobacteria bacterium]
MYRIKATSVVFCLTLFLSSCADRDESGQSSADTTQSDAAECRLVMGWDPWEPYQYMDVEGNIIGLDVELVSAIVEKAGCGLSFAEGNWSQLLAKLRDGEIDLLAGATRTASREQFAFFSEPYRNESFVLYVRAGELQKYPDATLNGVLEKDFRLGVTLDYIYGDEVSALQSDPNFSDSFVDAPISELNYSKLTDFEIDGFLEDPIVASAILRRKGLRDEIVAHPLEIESGVVHLMLSRASLDEQFVASLDEGLRGLLADGTLEAILAKYRD